MIAEIPPVKRYYEGMGVILALHQVRELQHDWHDPSTEGFPGEAGLKRLSEKPAWRSIRPDALRTSPTSLERLISDMQSTGYRFVSMNDLYHALIKGHTGEKLACITLDDGYRDNLTHALPLFERLQVPFTVYVVVDFIERKLFPWWLALKDLIRTTDFLQIDGRTHACRTWNEKNQTYRHLLLELGTIETALACEKVHSALHNAGMPLDPYYEEMLSRDEIRILASHPLCTIGSHTLTHPKLALLSKESSYEEIQKSKIALESILGRPVQHFAYPYGSPGEIGWREVELARKAGYHTAVTTVAGAIYPAHARVPWALPRRKVFEDTQVSDMYRPRRYRIVRFPTP